MDAAEAARRWVETWRRGWPAKDVDSIAALYSPEAVYRALAFREPDRGLGGVRRYLEQNFAAEHELECWFGEPVIQGDRVAVEWWGTWIEEGTRLAMAGATVLRFDTAGLVVDHRDYWNQSDRPERPYSRW